MNDKFKPRVGDVVLAIGNPLNLGQTITQGIISATGKQNLIDSPAAVYRWMQRLTWETQVAR